MNGEDLKYWSLQGTIDLFERVNGLPMGGRWLGDVSSIEFEPSPQKTDYKENFSGNRTIGLSLYQGTEATIAITLHNLSTRNFELILAGDTVEQDSAAVVDAVIFPGTPKVGDTFLLGSYDVTSLTLKDSTTGTAKTLTAGTHFTVDTKTGRGIFTDVTSGGGFQGPILASFTPGDVTYVKMLTNTEREKWIHISAKNTAVAGMPRMGIDFYKAKLLPSSLQFINEERGDAVLNATVLGDPEKEPDGDFGIFGRAVML